MSDFKKIDLSKVRRPAKQQETRAFDDPLQPGEEFVITLEFPVYFHEAGAVVRRANELLEFWRDPETGFVRLPPVDGVPTTIDEVSAQGYAALELFQPQPPAYTFQELNSLSVLMPNALTAAVAWANTLLPNEGGVKRGRKIGSGLRSSASRSTPSTSTPNGASGTTRSSVPSTPASATSASASAEPSEEEVQRSLDASLMGSERAGSRT